MVVQLDKHAGGRGTATPRRNCVSRLALKPCKRRSVSNKEREGDCRGSGSQATPRGGLEADFDAHC
jgi:hypothetical protein